MDDVLKWPSVAQAAERLGCRVESVYNAILRGRLHAERCALGLLIDPASLDNYARTRRPVRRKGERVA
jgi:Helix-turn-helix domain